MVDTGELVLEGKKHKRKASGAEIVLGSRGKHPLFQERRHQIVLMTMPSYRLRSDRPKSF